MLSPEHLATESQLDTLHRALARLAADFNQPEIAVPPEYTTTFTAKATILPFETSTRFPDLPWLIERIGARVSYDPDGRVSLILSRYAPADRPGFSHNEWKVAVNLLPHSGQPVLPSIKGFRRYQPMFPTMANRAEIMADMMADRRVTRLTVPQDAMGSPHFPILPLSGVEVDGLTRGANSAQDVLRADEDEAVGAGIDLIDENVEPGNTLFDTLLRAVGRRPSLANRIFPTPLTRGGTTKIEDS